MTARATQKNLSQEENVWYQSSGHPLGGEGAGLSCVPWTMNVSQTNDWIPELQERQTQEVRPLLLKSAAHARAWNPGSCAVRLAHICSHLLASVSDSLRSCTPYRTLDWWLPTETEKNCKFKNHPEKVAFLHNFETSPPKQKGPFVRTWIPSSYPFNKKKEHFSWYS